MRHRRLISKAAISAALKQSISLHQREITSIETRGQWRERYASSSASRQAIVDAVAF